MPVYFYTSDNRIVRDEREIRRLLKEKKGRWLYNFSHGRRRYKGRCVDPETGEAATTSKEAERIESRMRQAVLDDRYGEETKNLSFEAFAKDIYLKWVLQRNRAKKWYTSMVETLCRHFGAMPLRKITTDDIETYLMRRREEITLRGAERSGSSCNREHAILMALFNRAIKKGYYAGENPCRGVERYAETGRRQHVLSGDEEMKLMAALNKRNPILGHIVQLALKTGMRRGELLNLRWEWLDFTRGKKGYINLPATICKSKKPRSIPMLFDVREILLELRGSEEKTEGAVLGLDMKHAGDKILRTCQKIGLNGVSLHVMRHTFATRCLDAGVHPFVVKQWLGHQKLDMTDYYSHIGFDEMENAAAKLEAKVSENEAKNGQVFAPSVLDFPADAHIAVASD